jgi:urease accessory protein
VWALLQLVDSAFPAGGFVHSGGLEAATALGFVKNRDDLLTFASATIWQVGFGSVPFLSRCYETSFVEADSACDAFLWSNVARQASETQGRALLLAAERIWNTDPIAHASTSVRAMQARGHFAPTFGVVAAAAQIGLDDARRAMLFSALRNVLSAGVRLGLAGPFEAQRMHHELTPVLDAADQASASLRSAAQVAPLVELVQSEHMRLGVRLFQS